MAGIETITCTKHDWLDECRSILIRDGVVIIGDLVSRKESARFSNAIEESLRIAESNIGYDILHRSGERGVVRCPFIYDGVFFELFSNTQILEIVESLLDPAAICHLQNGIVLKPKSSDEKMVFQETFHRDFPRYLSGYLASVNTFFCLSDFTIENGGTRFLVGSHQSSNSAEPIECEEWVAQASSGSVIVFDSTIWHAGGSNGTRVNRNAMNMQWTRSFIKQQIDLVRLIEPEIMCNLPERTQQILGYYTRTPSNLKEYYAPQNERFYRLGQG